MISIIGPGQGTAGFTWTANPEHARDLIAWDWIGAVDSSSTVTGYSYNDKDNEKRTG